MAYMDYMDLLVHWLKKAVKLNQSLIQAVHELTVEKCNIQNWKVLMTPLICQFHI